MIEDLLLTNIRSAWIESLSKRALGLLRYSLLIGRDKHAHVYFACATKSNLDTVHSGTGKHDSTLTATFKTGHV